MALNDTEDSGSPNASTSPTPPSVETHSPSHWPITRPNGLPPLYVDLSYLPVLEPEDKNRNGIERVGGNVQRLCDDSVQYVGRPVKQEEADAYAFHCTNAVQTTCNLITPLLLGGTLIFSWRGRRQFRFPFYTPKWTVYSPNRFLLFRDRLARGAWHGLRISAYLVISAFCAPTVAEYYGLYEFTTGTSRDPRLADLRQGQSIPLKRQTTGKAVYGDQGKKDANGLGDGTTETMDDMFPADASVADEYQDHYQQTDKKALLEAIRRSDGKSSPDSGRNSGSDPALPPAESVSRSAAQESQSNGSAWDRLRGQVERQSPPTGQGHSRGTEETDFVNDSRS